jgi:hypothetical protein
LDIVGSLDGAVWFWLAALVFWSRINAETVGVPHGLLRRARHDPTDAALAEALARRELAARGATSGAGVAFTAFVLGFIAVYAATTRSPLGGGLFCLLGPAAGLAFWQDQAARGLERLGPADLRRGLERLRLAGLSVAAGSLSLAALWRGALQQGAALEAWGLWR